MDKIKNLIHISIFAALTAIGAYIIIPIGVVPITLQTVFVLLSGYVLGARKGALSQIVYVVIGLIGLPVYARGGAGLGHLMGPSGGYIFGFILSSFCVGILFGNKKCTSIIKLFFVFIIGLLAIYICGTVQLMFVGNMNLIKALSIGFLPFILFDIIKIIILIAVIRYLGRK